MSKVLVTLDYYDGTQGKAKEMDVENLSIRDLMWRMMENDVCGFTVTKLPQLKKLQDKMEEAK